MKESVTRESHSPALKKVLLIYFFTGTLFAAVIFGVGIRVFELFSSL